jgi:hypothetical protein
VTPRIFDTKSRVGSTVASVAPSIFDLLAELPRYTFVSPKEHHSAAPAPPPKAEESATAAIRLERVTRRVSPEVAEFIDRVVVPALLKRYIGQSNPTGAKNE